MSRTICLIDTSILIEILEVPRKCTSHEFIFSELTTKIKNKEALFLPLATILEAGNHIAQNGDGEQRRKCADKFVKFVQDALDGISPFQPIKFFEKEQLSEMLKKFPDYAMREISLGDASIITDYEKLCKQNKYSNIYIWSLDAVLLAYEQRSIY